MGVKNLHYLDLQHSYGKEEHFDFLRKFGELCYVRHLNIDSLETDLTDHLPEMGRAMGDNLRLETLSM
jgi:hypothetical protein